MEVLGRDFWDTEVWKVGKMGSWWNELGVDGVEVPALQGVLLGRRWSGEVVVGRCELG